MLLEFIRSTPVKRQLGGKVRRFLTNRQRASGHDGVFDPIFFLLELLQSSFNHMKFQARGFEGETISNISIILHISSHATSLAEAVLKLHRPNVSQRYNSLLQMITRLVQLLFNRI